jgi:elongation factor P
MATPVINLRRGNAVKHNNDVCVVLDMQHKTPPNLAAFVQMSVRSIATGKVYSLRLTPNDRMDQIPLLRDDYEYSYKDSAGYHFLHLQSYDDVTVSEDLIEPVRNYLLEGQAYVLLAIEGNVAAVELPSSMIMTIAEAPEGVKGDSANNVYKSAITETGLTIQVPLFIKPGDRITVKTQDGAYVGRAS